MGLWKASIEERFHTFFKVILPLTAPGIVAGSILVFIPSMGAYLVPVLIGNNRVPMLGTMLDHEFMTASNWPLGAALSFVLMTIMLAGTMIYLRIVRKQA